MGSPMGSTGTSMPAPAVASGGGGGDDWTTQIADTIEAVVGSVKNKTTVPVETLARIVVYGLVIVVLTIAALVLAGAGLIRVLGNWLPIWGVYLAVGGLFTVLGLLCWAFRRPRRQRKRG